MAAFIIFFLFSSANDSILQSTLVFRAADVAEIANNTALRLAIIINFLICLIVVLYLRYFSGDSSLRKSRKRHLLLAGLLFYISLMFVVDSLLSKLLAFLAIIVFSHVVTLWVDCAHDIDFGRLKNSRLKIVMGVMLFALSAASVWCGSFESEYIYQGRVRWSGPWDNPNVAGILMGVGTMLALGFGFITLRVFRIIRSVVLTLYCLAMVVMWYKLLDSYSRGAWLGTVGGLAYFCFQVFQCSRSHFIGWIRRNATSLLCIMLSAFIFGLWQFHSPQGITARRVSSIINQNDFSWYNRIAACEGALQIIKDNPFFGCGWSQPDVLYGHYYLSPALIESAAIEMNDYLLLGAALGIPALFLFVMYVWLVLSWDVQFRREILHCANRESESFTYELLKMTCRAGTVVLLIGFWFDGGLFKLSTASTFWILLELGNVQNTKHECALIDKDL